MATQKYLSLPGGLKMPIIGIGTWQAQDEAELKNALNAALEVGYRHIDTAFAYGNEHIIGDVLKTWFKSGKLKREDVFITTKLPILGVHPDRVEYFIKKSLENLQLDYVDLYLIHFPGGIVYDIQSGKSVHESLNDCKFEKKTDQAALWKKMEEQVDAGRTKTIGLSNYNISQIQTVLKSARIKPANLQVELHVFLQQPDLVEFCQKHGVTVVAYSPLGTPGYNGFLKKFGLEARDLPNILTNPVVGKIAKKHSKTPAQVALRFLNQLGIAAIPKSTNIERLKQNIDVFDFTLDAEDLKELKGLNKQFRICDWGIFPNIEKHPDYPFES